MPSSKSITITVLGSILIIYTYYVFTKKKAKPSHDDKESISGTEQKITAQGNDDLVTKFRNAAEEVSKLNTLNVTQSDKLMLYGLYKQATMGDRDQGNVVKPSSLNMVAWAKYEAWGKFQGLTQETAMKKYIEIVNHFSKTKVYQEEDENADIVYDEDDEEEEDEYEYTFQPKFGMGLKPSTLMVEEEVDVTGDSLDDKIRLASASEDATDLKRLLEENNNAVNINTMDESGQSPLHFAADQGSIECVKILLDAGANPNASDNAEISVLQAAAIRGNVEIVKLLLDAGADPDQEDVDGDSPRSCAEYDGTPELKALFRDTVSK